MKKKAFIKDLIILLVALAALCLAAINLHCSLNLLAHKDDESEL